MKILLLLSFEWSIMTSGTHIERNKQYHEHASRSIALLVCECHKLGF